jgi:hypothetical protein
MEVDRGQRQRMAVARCGTSKYQRVVRVRQQCRRHRLDRAVRVVGVRGPVARRGDARQQARAVVTIEALNSAPTTTPSFEDARAWQGSSHKAGTDSRKIFWNVFSPAWRIGLSLWQELRPSLRPEKEHRKASCLTMSE